MKLFRRLRARCATQPDPSDPSEKPVRADDVSAVMLPRENDTPLMALRPKKSRRQSLSFPPAIHDSPNAPAECRDRGLSKTSLNSLTKVVRRSSNLSSGFSRQSSTLKLNRRTSNLSSGGPNHLSPSEMLGVAATKRTLHGCYSDEPFDSNIPKEIRRRRGTWDVGHGEHDSDEDECHHFHRRRSSGNQLSGISSRIGNKHHMRMLRRVSESHEVSQSRRKEHNELSFQIFASNVAADSYDIRKMNTFNRTASQLAHEMPCAAAADLASSPQARMHGSDADFLCRQPSMSVAYRRNSFLANRAEAEYSLDFESGFIPPKRLVSKRLSVSCRPSRVDKIVF